jgi:hypothetical protein
VHVACLLVREDLIGLLVDVRIGPKRPLAEPADLCIGNDVVQRSSAADVRPCDVHLSPPDVVM